MKTFKFSCQVTVSAFTEVEAETLEAAMEEAASRQVIVGGINSGALSREEWIINEPDGEPFQIRHDKGD